MGTKTLQGLQVRGQCLSDVFALIVTVSAYVLSSRALLPRIYRSRTRRQARALKALGPMAPSVHGMLFSVIQWVLDSRRERNMNTLLYMLFLSRTNQSNIELESHSRPNQSLHSLNPTTESTASRCLSSTTKATSRKVRTDAWPAASENHPDTLRSAL